MNGLSTTFQDWERKTKDTKDFKLTYVDVANSDLIAGLMLSEIVFWYLPSRNVESKLRVFKKGHYWIAASRTEWWDRCRLTPSQVDRAIKVLVGQGILVKDHFLFGGKRILAVRLVTERFLELWESVTSGSDSRAVRSSKKQRAGLQESTTSESQIDEGESTVCTSKNTKEPTPNFESQTSRAKAPAEEKPSSSGGSSKEIEKDRAPTGLEIKVMDLFFDIAYKELLEIPERAAKIAAIVEARGGKEQHVDYFVDWYKRTYPKYQLPRDPEKFKLHWSKWLTVISRPNQAVQYVAASPIY